MKFLVSVSDIDSILSFQIDFFVVSFFINVCIFRFYPFLCNAIRDLVIERCDNDEITKHGRLQRTEFYLGILDVKTKHTIRHLTGDKVGKLIRISGQIVRTHQVHPELCLGTFVCDDCGVTIRNVPQQFQYTQVSFKVNL